jgi:hypothetical protein
MARWEKILEADQEPRSGPRERLDSEEVTKRKQRREMGCSLSCKRFLIHRHAENREGDEKEAKNGKDDDELRD